MLGYSHLGIDEVKQRGEAIHEAMTCKVKEVHGQKIYQGVQKSRHTERYKDIYTAYLPEYLMTDKENEAHRKIAMAMCGNIEVANRYWLRDEGTANS